MFFALKGPNFNANDFAHEALQKGAAHAVVDDLSVVQDDRFILVDDVLESLQELGRHHRRQFSIPVVGITGSNGKTTTKELMHAILAADRPTLATSGNLNNHIGVPLTLLRLNSTHRCAIIEMGANKPGDIAELAGLAEPTHGLITNIGKAHLEGFGGLEGVIRTKTELYKDLSHRNAVAFVDNDDPLLMDKSHGLQRVTYGTSATADWIGIQEQNGPFLGLSWQHHGKRSGLAKTRLIGGYNFKNAMAAVAVGGTLGVSDEKMRSALTNYEPSNNRSQLVETAHNLLVMDAYNANPTSMRSALENFAVMEPGRPRLAILGDMLELGQDSIPEHEEVVRRTQELDLATYFVGPLFMGIVPGPNKAQDAKAALEHFTRSPVRDHLILIKGSRGIRLETLREVL